MRRQIWAAFLVLGLLVPIFAATSNREDDVQRIQHAEEVLKAIQAIPDQGIPSTIMDSAQCLAVIPGEKKFALGIGGQYGKGLAVCRNNGVWSAPVFITVGGASWGLQIGGQSSDVVMVFRNRHGIDSLLSNKVKIGAGASAAAGPIGRHAEASTDASLNAEILTYSRSHGAFAGVSLNGAIVQPDETGNIAMYGTAPRYQQILGGKVPVPAVARPLLREVSTVTGVGRLPAPHARRRTRGAAAGNSAAGNPSANAGANGAAAGAGASTQPVAPTNNAPGSSTANPTPPPNNPNAGAAPNGQPPRR